MPRFVYVQVTNVEKPARIEADKVEKKEGAGGALMSLVLKKGNTEVGEFKGSAISGWWIQDEE